MLDLRCIGGGISIVQLKLKKKKTHRVQIEFGIRATRSADSKKVMGKIPPNGFFLGYLYREVKKKTKTQ